MGLQIEERVRQDDLHAKAKARRAQLGELFVESKTDFLEPTVPKIGPQHVRAKPHELLYRLNGE